VGYNNEIMKRRKLGSEVWMLDVVADCARLSAAAVAVNAP